MTSKDGSRAMRLFEVCIIIKITGVIESSIYFYLLLLRTLSEGCFVNERCFICLRNGEVFHGRVSMIFSAILLTKYFNILIIDNIPYFEAISTVIMPCIKYIYTNIQ